MSHASVEQHSAQYPIGAEPGWRPDPSGAEQERWWDGRHWSDQVRPLPGAAPATRASRRAKGPILQLPDGRQIDRQSRIMGIATQINLMVLAFATAVAVIALIVNYSAVSIALGKSENGASQLDPKSLVDTSDVVVRTSLLTYAGLLALSLIVTLTWFAVRARDPRVNRLILRRSTTATVVSCFVPIIQLWWPAQGFKDLWHASRPEMAGIRGREGLPYPASVFTWWIALLASTIGPTVLAVLASLHAFYAPTVQGMQATLGGYSTVLGISFACSACSTFALLSLVRQVEAHLAAPDYHPGNLMPQIS